MKKTALKVSAAALVIAGAFALTGCGDKETGVGKYTYHDVSSNPKTWSPTDWSMENEGSILDYTTSPLYSFIPNETKDGYEIIPELAEKMAEDVTAEYAGNPLYGIEKGTTSGRAFRIKLVEYAKWEDGTPIDAHDVEYSIQQFINPDMKNFRGNLFYADSFCLANARGYYNGGIAYNDVEEGDDLNDLWTSLSQPVVFFGDAIQSYGGDSDYGEYWVTEDGTNLWEKLTAIAGESTFFRVTDEVKELYTQMTEAFGDDPNNWVQWCFTRVEQEATPWSDVGFILNDDYTFTVILDHPYSNFMFYYNVGSIQLLNKTLYEQGKQQTGDIIKSKYGTSIDLYSSYGPYKISAFQPDKSISFVKNENWYGYTDGRHEGLYQTTGIDLQFITDHETIKNLFLQGKLDSLGLAATDMAQYGNSEYRVETPESYTYKFSFNIDRESLEKEDGDGINHSIIANINFRHAVSLAMNRTKWCETTSPASQPGFGLVNYAYVAVPESGELYRDTPEAKKVLMDFYGTTSMEDITGYDIEKAREYFQTAYDEEVDAGHLAPTDKVQIDYHAYSASEGNQRRVSFIQDSINNATTGTSLEGKVTVNLIVDQQYYDNMKTGAVDLAFTAWGGSAFDPYGILWCYCTTDALNEYGMDPMTETVTINLNGKNLTKTLNEWYEALCAGEYTDSDNSTKNAILAGVEANLLGRYNMIPIEYLSTLSLDSQRLIEYSDHYINGLVGRGSIRELTWSMDDAEWNKWCKKNHNQLQY